MRLLLLLAALALVPALAHAQGNATDNSTNSTATNTTAASTDNSTANSTAPAGPLEITLVGNSDGASNYWTIEGQTAHNPSITVQPGQQVVFHVKAASGSHNFKVGSIGPSDVFSEGDAPITVTWTAPDSAGDVTYICTIHGSQMSGKIHVGAASAPATSSGGSDNVGGPDISGDTVDVPGCPGGKVPAVINDGVTGAPTMNDYVTKCQSVGGATAAPPKSGADYVLPVSFGLIALGIVGVVWVHKSYKP